MAMSIIIGILGEWHNIRHHHRAGGVRGGVAEQAYGWLLLAHRVKCNQKSQAISIHLQSRQATTVMYIYAQAAALY